MVGEKLWGGGTKVGEREFNVLCRGQKTINGDKNRWYGLPPLKCGTNYLYCDPDFTNTVNLKLDLSL
jgi:hypothetical protein